MRYVSKEQIMGYKHLSNEERFYIEARRAQTLSITRCKSTSRKSAILSQISAEAISLINKNLSERTSPEQICGRVLQEFKTQMSHQTLYRYIWKDRSQGGSLYLNLRRRGKKNESL